MSLNLRDLIEDIDYREGEVFVRAVWGLLTRGKPGMRELVNRLGGERGDEIREVLLAQDERLVELVIAPAEKDWSKETLALLDLLDPALMVTKALASLQRGEPDKARRLAAMAAERLGDAMTARTAVQMGDIAAGLGEWGTAASWYRKSLAAGGSAAERLGKVYGQWAWEKAGEGLGEEWEKLGELNPSVDVLGSLAGAALAWSQARAREELSRIGRELSVFTGRLKTLEELTEEAATARESLPERKASLARAGRAGQELALGLTRQLQILEEPEPAEVDLSLLLQEVLATEKVQGVTVEGEAAAYTDPDLCRETLRQVVTAPWPAPLAVSLGVENGWAALAAIGGPPGGAAMDQRASNCAFVLRRQGGRLERLPEGWRLAWPTALQQTATGAEGLVNAFALGRAGSWLLDLPNWRARGETLSAAVGHLCSSVVTEVAPVLIHGVHDLKNGFVFISSWAEELGEESTPRAMVIDRLKSLLANMNQSVTSLRDFLAVVDRPSEATSVVGRWLEESLKALGGVFAARQIKVERRLPQANLTIRGDRARLVWALANLLLNAAEAVPEGGQIEVSVQDEGEWVAVTVQDSGPGISAGEGRVRTGRGVGLPSAERAVAEMGGQLAFTSGDGGTAVTIRVQKIDPLAMLRAALPNWDDLSPQTQQGLRVARELVETGQHPEMAVFLLNGAVETELKERVLSLVQRHRLLPTALALQGVREAASIQPLIEAIIRNKMDRVTGDFENLADCLWWFGQTHKAGGVAIQNPAGLSIPLSDLEALCEGLRAMGQRPKAGQVSREHLPALEQQAWHTINFLSRFPRQKGR